MTPFFTKRLLIGVLAALGAGNLLASALGWWGVLPAFFVSFWLGNELFSEAQGDDA